MRLICGYRRTGKDTLCQMMSNPIKETFPWLIYTKSNINRWKLLRPGTRRAFADNLKLRIQEQLKEAGIIFDYEAEKDSYIFEFRGHLTTYRQECITYGRKHRELWPRILLEQCDEDTIVTDFRFPDEFYLFRSQWPELLTIRVFRMDVPIPPLDETSEHSLDNFLTDCLFVPTPDDFTAAVKQFPQYRDYVLLDN